MKKTLIATILTTLALGVNTSAAQYPTTAIVTEIDEVSGIITVEECNGNIWTFYDDGTEDWYVNDICSMIMDDKGTKLVYDDEIISTRYSGFVDDNFMEFVREKER